MGKHGLQDRKPHEGCAASPFSKNTVPTITQEGVRSMLKACAYSKEADTNLRKLFAIRRPTAKRDVAILLVLLDSDVRASELCAMTIGDLDIKRRKHEIKHRVVSGVNGGKGRLVYLGKISRQAVWRYLQDREDVEYPDVRIFVASGMLPFNPAALRQLAIVISCDVLPGCNKRFPKAPLHWWLPSFLEKASVFLVWCPLNIRLVRLLRSI